MLKASLSITSSLIFQFRESWRLLLDWMTEVEQTLDTHKEIAVSHEEIKQQLIEQKVQHHNEYSFIHQWIQLHSYEPIHWSILWYLGVPETAEVQEAHVRGHAEERPQPPRTS